MDQNTLPIQPTEGSVVDREILLGDDLFKIPERLLLAHARGETLFITGAGSSMPALPDFKNLVLEVYKKLDRATFDVLRHVPNEPAMAGSTALIS